MSKAWTQEEKDFLIKNYKKIPTKEISLFLKKSTETIRQQAFVLKINKPVRDLPAGERYGLLAIIKKTSKRAKNGSVYYLCKCDCGNEKNINKDLLLSVDGTKSCGCLIAESTRERFSQDAGKATFNHLYRLCKNGARKRGKNFDLSKEEHKNIVSQDCYFCGEKPHPYNFYVFTSKGFKKLRARTNISQTGIDRAWILVNTVDRLINNKGYSADNCVAACWPCNRSKYTGTEKDLIEHAYKIIAFQEKKKLKEAM